MNTLNPFWLVILAGAISLVPIVLSLGTSMLKISIVLSLIKQSLGTQSVPGPMVTMSLSLVLTWLVMGSTFSACYEALPSDYLTVVQRAPTKENIARIGAAVAPWKMFLEKHSGPREVVVLDAINPERGLGFGELILAFMLTELREAFTLGFVLLIPFLVIDLIVSQILVGIGLTMLSPTLISLPLKLLLFVASDAWIVISRGLIQSYGATGG